MGIEHFRLVKGNRWGAGRCRTRNRPVLRCDQQLMPALPLTDESFREVASRYATGVVVVTTQTDGFDRK